MEAALSRHGAFLGAWDVSASVVAHSHPTTPASATPPTVLHRNTCKRALRGLDWWQADYYWLSHQSAPQSWRLRSNLTQEEVALERNLSEACVQPSSESTLATSQLFDGEEQSPGQPSRASSITTPSNHTLSSLEDTPTPSHFDAKLPSNQNSDSETPSITIPGSKEPSPDLSSPLPTANDAPDLTSTSLESGLEESAPVPKQRKTVLYIVDIMPICFRGRGRGKLDPRACVEWMEALVGIAEDSPIIGVLDGADGNAWRRELYPDYKTGRKLYRPFPTIGHRRNRHPVHIDPFVNMPMLEPLFRLLNVPVLKVPHAEADDVIATLAQQAVDMGHRVNVVSPDTDLRQLLNERISIWAPRAELMPQFNFFDGRKFEDRVGYPPEKFVLLRCLLGDQSDNIRGLPYYVPEFGRNSAIKLIEKFGSVAELLAAARERTIGRPYVQEAVLEYSQVLELNEKLITLRRDVEDVVLDPTWLLPRDRSTDRKAYHAANSETIAMKKAGKMVLVRPSKEADWKLSGVPKPPKPPRPPKDKSPKWPPGFQDYKGLLHNACARAKCPVPEYSLETDGLVHEPLHRATVVVAGETATGSWEPLKKSAEHAAARIAWEALLRAQGRSADLPPEQQGDAVHRTLLERTHGGTIFQLLGEQLQPH